LNAVPFLLGLEAPTAPISAASLGPSSEMAEHGGKDDDLNILSALREPLEEEQLKDAHGLPVKYQGTRADQQDMMILGKKQVLRVCTHLCA
jgi:hypothetical protein